jgi:hypothetical protein
VAAEHARVGEVEVEVGVAIHVGEARPAAAVDDDRRMLVEAEHPGHRHPVRHDRPRLFDHSHPARPQLGEPVELALAQHPDPVAWDLAHPGDDPIRARPGTWCRLGNGRGD